MTRYKGPKLSVSKVSVYFTTATEKDILQCNVVAFLHLAVELLLGRIRTESKCLVSSVSRCSFVWKGWSVYFLCVTDAAAFYFRPKVRNSFHD
jgi:hypothetical protein